MSINIIYVIFRHAQIRNIILLKVRARFFLYIQKNTIVVTVFSLIMNQMKSRLVRNQKENCHYDRIFLSILKETKTWFCEKMH